MHSLPELLVSQEFDHPEGLVWDHCRSRLLWVDIFRGHILTYDMKSDRPETFTVGQAVGAVAPRSLGGFVCATREGFGHLSEDGRYVLTCPVLREKPHLQMNDGSVDALGRFWAGSMARDSAAHPGAGALYRHDADGTSTIQLNGVTISNGIGWSPDSRRCYYVDSVTRRIDQFSYDLAAGRLTDRRSLAEVDALPDGLAVDADGCIWVAMFGGSNVKRFTPNGKMDRTIEMPGTQVTTCAFGGSDLRTLFIAVSAYGLSEHERKIQKAGFIYAVQPGVQGVPGNEFAG